MAAPAVVACTNCVLHIPFTMQGLYHITSGNQRFQYHVAAHVMFRECAYSLVHLSFVQVRRFSGSACVCLSPCTLMTDKASDPGFSPQRTATRSLGSTAELRIAVFSLMKNVGTRIKRAVWSLAYRRLDTPHRLPFRSNKSKHS